MNSDIGLTNLGTALQSNHEDAEHPKHCIEKTCLMFWSRNWWWYR
jgi:hypothetical protein